MIWGNTHNTSTAEKGDDEVHKLVEDVGDHSDRDVTEGENDDHDVEDELEDVRYVPVVKGGLCELLR